jgi:hypothetical protein
MKNIFKKVAMSLLSLSMLFSMVASPAYATEAISGENDVIDENSISRADLFISDGLAQEISRLFINDMISTGDVAWNTSTRIVGITTMYDGTEEHNITAYTVELNTGYVVVSAYVDVPNVILEWSDSAAPLYNEFDLEATDEIVYGGSLFYYKDDGKDQLETLTGLSVDRSNITNVLKTKYDITNVPTVIVSALIGKNKSSTMTTTPGSSSVITNPISHANQWYNGPYSCNDYQNHWETGGKSIECHRTSEYSNLGNGFKNHCGPTAITNMLVIYGNRFGISKINKTDDDDIFLKVAKIGTSNLYYINSNALGIIGGTANSSANKYILDSFAAYNVSGITVKGRYSINYTNVEISLRNDRLLYLLLNDHNLYGDHHVVCYAYTRLVSSTDGSYVTYLKVADGWANTPRYIDIASVSGDKYWEVNY